MSLTTEERTVRIVAESRKIYVSDFESENRIVHIPVQNRVNIIVEKRTTSSQRTVLVE